MLKRLIAASLLFLILSTNVQGQQKRKVWSWKDVSTKHDAVVKVGTPGGSGTGALCAKSGTQGLIISAAHVTGRSPSANITFPKQKQIYTHKVIAADHNLDVCFLWGHVPSNVAPIPLANKQPAAGEYVEVLGFGGPTGHLRCFWSRIKTIDRTSQTLESCVISGDSGGPIISKDGIVGVVTGGYNTQPTNTQWDLVYPILGPHVDAIATVYTQCGIGGNCQPYSSPDQNYNWLAPVPPPPEGIYSQPIQKPEIQPVPEPIPESPPAGCPCEPPEIDYKKLVEELIKNEEFLAAIQGPAGKDGKDGSDAVCPEPNYEDIAQKIQPLLNYEEIAQETQPFLDPVGLQILDFEGNPLPVVNDEGRIVGDTSWKNLGDYFKIQLLERDLIKQ